MCICLAIKLQEISTELYVAIWISVDLCYGFLTHPWYDQNGCEEYGALCNILLDELLIGYFKDAKLSFVRDHVTWINAELNTFVKNDKKATFKTFPCFKKYDYKHYFIAIICNHFTMIFEFIFRNNFSVLFRVLYSSMISMLERKIDKNARKIGQLKLWENSHKLVAMFLDIVKSLDMPRNFSLFLKVKAKVTVKIVCHTQRESFLSQKFQQFLLFFSVYTNIFEAFPAPWNTHYWKYSQRQGWTCIGIAP